MWHPIFVLASAEGTDLSGSEWGIVMIALAVIVVAAALAMLPIGIARYRRHTQHSAIAAMAVLWALVVAGTVLQTVSAELKWSREYVLMLKTGYYDPRDTSGAPEWPWRIWIALAVGFGILVLYAAARRSK